ncbi:MAG TPA: methyltransferase, partial [Rhizomicrobium sp.]|nr:methyltransferase [Rhizomicrobium sp.]
AETLIQDGRAAEAARFLRARIEAGRGGVLARTLLVKALLAEGAIDAALEAARDTASLNPALPEAVTALGDALLAAGHLPAAIAEYQRALRIDAEAGLARLKLGAAWLEAGETDKAREQFAMLDLADWSARLAPFLERIKAMQTQRRSDAGYVRHLFDQFSADYDARMRGQLAYQAPEVLRALADLVMPGAHDLTVLDLGCGTGLAGVAFADLTSAIDGIDLSPAMIARARDRKLYRNLAVGDLETGLGNGRADYDLVLAADTLVYLGDLTPTFTGVAHRLKPHGFFLFTVERSPHTDFELGPKRRWQHSEEYLRALAATARLDVAGAVACAPRLELSVPVDGLALALQKPL